MVERKRERTLAVRMLDAELQMVGEIARHEGVNVSEWIRNIIRREHAIAVAQGKLKPKRKK